MRLTRLIHPNSFGICLLGCCGLLAWLSRAPQFLNLPTFAGTMGLMFAFYVIAYRTIQQSGSHMARTVFFWALLLRLSGLLGEPIFEDDYFRYLWDGYRFASDGTPFGRPPESFFNDPSVPKAFRTILSQINHPDIPTIYAPTFQYFFLIANWIAPGQLWALKLLLIAADLLLIQGLFRFAGAKQTLLYAWNPLVIKEIAFTAHPDGLIPALLIGSWLFSSRGRPIIAGLMLVAAVASKASAWLLVPFIAINIGCLGIAAFVGGYLLLYLPFWVQGATDMTGLRVFAQEFEFNSALYGLIRLGLPANWTKMLLGIAFIGMTSVYFFRYWRLGSQNLPRGDWLFGGLLIISPVINPWYLLWLMPFACIYSGLGVWIASAALILSYVTGLNLQDFVFAPYEHPSWVRPLEFGIIALGMAFDKRQSVRTPSQSRGLDEYFQPCELPEFNQRMN